MSCVREVVAVRPCQLIDYSSQVTPELRRSRNSNFGFQPKCSVHPLERHNSQFAAHSTDGESRSHFAKAIDSFNT